MWVGGEKTCGAMEKGEPYMWREEKDKETSGEISAQFACTRKTPPQNHWLGNPEGLTIASFYKYWSSNSEVLEVCAIQQSQARWEAAIPRRRRPGALEQTVWCRDPLSHTGREYSPSFWSTFWRRYIASLKIKDLVNAIEHPFISKGQKCAQDR